MLAGRDATAKGHAAAKLRARQAELLAQRPQKWRCRIHIQFTGFAVDNKASGSHANHPQNRAELSLLRYGPRARASMTETLEDVTDRPYSLFPISCELSICYV